MRILLLTVVSLAAALTACQPGGTTEQTTDHTIDHTIDVSGTARTYRVHVPAGLTGPAPLVVMLHGGFGSGAQAERAYGWDTLADQRQFVVAYPDGLDRAWNTGGGCCGRPATTGVDDVGFVTAMVAAIEQEIAIDPARVYATGMSNGAIMAYTLACRTDQFAAVAPVAGTQLGACEHPAPTSVVHVHGTADPRVPFAGGRGNGFAHIDGPGVEDVVAGWRAVDGCGRPTTTTAATVTTSAATCPAGRAVELVSVAGGGHAWPMLPTLDTTALVWDFFAAHPR